MKTHAPSRTSHDAERAANRWPLRPKRPFGETRQASGAPEPQDKRQPRSAARLGYSFGAVGVLPGAVSAAPRNVASIQPRDTFQDDPVPEPRETPPTTPVPPREAPASACPTFREMSVTVGTPHIYVGRRDTCRFGPGSSCPDGRECGSSTTSGARFDARISLPTGCAGQLAFMHNTTSVARRLVLADGSRACKIADSPHHDGGPPWKTCTVDVASAGDHQIRSDDCPSQLLDGNMTGDRARFRSPRSAEVSDSFRLYLMWKPADSERWQMPPLAQADWSWGGTAVKAADATAETPCAERYTVQNPSSSDGTGTTPAGRPVSTPRIRDVGYGSCS